MRVTLIVLAVITGCTGVGGAAPRSPVDSSPPKAPIEAIRPLVSLEQLVNDMPDAAQVIGLYQAARTVSDVEAANANVKAQVAKVQAIATDLARLHAATSNSCQDTDASQINAIGQKVKVLSVTLARVDGELTKSLAAMPHKVEAERPTSIRAKEDVNRLELATHELGRLQVQAQEVAKGVKNLGASIRRTATSCIPTPVPAMFAERGSPTNIAIPARRPPSLSNRRGMKPVNASAPRLPW
jgi:capsid protein